MKVVILTRGPRCKCSCNSFTGDDGKKYWFDYRTNIVYSTDCHNSNPIPAKGTFIIDNQTYKQNEN